MSLLREIRDGIYIFALVSPLPIIIRKGEWISESQHPNPDDMVYTGYADWVDQVSYVRRLAIDQTASKSSLNCLSTNILFCSNIISQEAAAVFYNLNTFSFFGDHNWDPVFSWLETIGAQNRDRLSILKVNAYNPHEVWQRFNGERIERYDESDTVEAICPRSPHLHFGCRPSNTDLSITSILRWRWFFSC